MSVSILQNSCPDMGRVKNTEVYSVSFWFHFHKNVPLLTVIIVFGKILSHFHCVISERKFGLFGHQTQFEGKPEAAHQ